MTLSARGPLSSTTSTPAGGMPAQSATFDGYIHMDMDRAALKVMVIDDSTTIRRRPTPLVSNQSGTTIAGLTTPRTAGPARRDTSTRTPHTRLARQRRRERPSRTHPAANTSSANAEHAAHPRTRNRSASDALAGSAAPVAAAASANPTTTGNGVVHVPSPAPPVPAPPPTIPAPEDAAITGSAQLPHNATTHAHRTGRPYNAATSSAARAASASSVLDAST